MSQDPIVNIAKKVASIALEVERSRMMEKIAINRMALKIQVDHKKNSQ